MAIFAPLVAVVLATLAVTVDAALAGATGGQYARQADEHVEWPGASAVSM